MNSVTNREAAVVDQYQTESRHMKLPLMYMAKVTEEASSLIDTLVSTHTL